MSSHAAKSHASAARPASTAQRILLADDDPHYRACLAVLLKQAGFEVVEAHDAAAARAALGGDNISVVVSDINMPGNERLDFVREVAGRHPGLPFILITGYPTAETAIDSVNLGVVSYLRKPVDPHLLLDTVQRAIGLTETRRVLTRSLGHLRDWTEDLERLDRQMQHARDAAQHQAVGTFLDVSLRRLTVALADVREVLGVLARSPGGSAGLRTHDLERAVKDAVGVLERTKRDFKSKELAELRQRLESLLDLPG